MSRNDVIAVQVALGLLPDGHLGPASRRRILESVKDSIPTMPDPEAPLHVRAVRFCLVEAEKWGKVRVPKERVAEYFRACQRGEKNIGEWLAGEVLSGKHHSFCAAAIGYAERAVARPGEKLAPARAGAAEYMIDAQNGIRGSWQPASKVTAFNHPLAGDLAIYTRPGGHHVEAVAYAVPNGYSSVGANEQGGRWIVDSALLPYNAERLLGFVRYVRSV